jgi:hypothetical protein
MPLMVFMLVKAQVVPSAPPTGAAVNEALARFWDGLTEHLIVFSIVTSCVSTFTSFPRLFSYSLEDAPIGRASLGLVMLITLILVFSVAMYTLHEARVTGAGAAWPASLLVLVTLATSFYMEFAIANVRLARREAHATA